MPGEFSGIEKRLDELSERLARLEPLRNKKREEFDADPYLRDIAERNNAVCGRETGCTFLLHSRIKSPFHHHLHLQCPALVFSCTPTRP
jgi:hypothetical protein